MVRVRGETSMNQEEQRGACFIRRAVVLMRETPCRIKDLAASSSEQRPLVLFVVGDFLDPGPQQVDDGDPD